MECGGKPGRHRFAFLLVEHIIALEHDAHALAECDRRADERFLMLDAMEAQDGETQAG